MLAFDGSYPEKLTRLPSLSGDIGRWEMCRWGDFDHQPTSATGGLVRCRVRSPRGWASRASDGGSAWRVERHAYDRLVMDGRSGRTVPSFESDSATTQARIELLRDYMDQHVFGQAGFVCESAAACRRSVMFDTRGNPRDNRCFSEGQLSHVGHHYDLTSNGSPLHILVIAMETGREDVGVTLEDRRLQLAQSAALAFASRNPHMRGTTSALRAAIGRQPADDRLGELIDLPNEPAPLHLFDCYAMANIRLCSATVAGTSSSRGTRTMSRNCLRHLSATIEILEPTMIIVQGVPVADDLEPIVTTRERLSDELRLVTIGGVDAVLASFTHPSAKSLHQHWGRLTSADYLWDTVTPPSNWPADTLGLGPGEMVEPGEHRGHPLPIATERSRWLTARRPVLLELCCRRRAPCAPGAAWRCR